MPQRFEMIEKRRGRTVTTRSDEVRELLLEMSQALSGPIGPNGPRYSVMRGEIEIGIEGGAQILLRVVPE